MARTAGFCWGVKRAMEMTLTTAKAKDGPVYTHGPLIHNPQVIEMLEGKEVYALDDATKLESGTVIIRTHGVAPQVRRDLKARGLELNDATCPLVARVQGIIKKHAGHGYSIVIIGDAGHAEVIGLTGYAKNDCHVIGSAEEVGALPEMDKVCVVAQTTCDITKYKDIINAIVQKYPDAIISDTICQATWERQKETQKLAGEVDLMIVVGGRNSANTNRLAQLARETAAGTALIESEDDLDPELVRMYDRIGVTAGASTPSWMIQRVIDKVKSVTAEKPTTFGGALGRFIEVIAVSNISSAVGAALMVYANSALAGFRFSWGAAYIASAYFFSMYVLNQLNDTKTFKHNEPEKLRFYLEHRQAIKLAALWAALSAFAVSLALGAQVVFVYTVAMGLGLGYTVKWFPTSDIVRIHRLKDIPASKDFFVGFAWVAVTVIAPALAVGAPLVTAPLFVASAFTFTLVYIRSVVSDIRDIHGDRLVGRETIPILIGKTPTKIFVATLAIALSALLLTSAWLNLVGAIGYVLLLSVAYTAAYLSLYHARVISRGVPFDLALDGVFHVTGLSAVLWTILHG